MKLLLVGASGQLGWEISHHPALLTYHTIIPLSHAALDISDLDQVLKAYRHYQPDLVINAAAYTKVDLAEKEWESAYRINSKGAEHLASACEQFQIPLIHFSTDYIFNGEKETPYVEEDKASPLNIYGKSKWEGEVLIRQTCTKHIILRTSWVFGRQGHNFVKTILKLAQERETLQVVSDQIGCPTPTSGIADAVFMIVRKIKSSSSFWGTYHFCGEPAVSWYEFAKHIIQTAADIKPLTLRELAPIASAEYPTPARRPKHSILSCKKITAAFGIQPIKWLPILRGIITSELHEKL